MISLEPKRVSLKLDDSTEEIDALKGWIFREPEIKAILERAIDLQLFELGYVDAQTTRFHDRAPHVIDVNLRMRFFCDTSV